MKSKSIIIMLALVTVLFINCSEKEKEQAKVHEMSSQVESEVSELVRTGIIDVKSLDKNEDGKIYECPMDWNVLNDVHGDCPVCGMDMKEYSLEDIKVNLDKYGYEYKK